MVHGGPSKSTKDHPLDDERPIVQSTPVRRASWDPRRHTSQKKANGMGVHQTVIFKRVVKKRVQKTRCQKTRFKERVFFFETRLKRVFLKRVF